MLQKSKKEKIIKDLSETIKEASSVVFVNFHGMKVTDETILRRNLRSQGVAYKVSRKTLLKKVLGEVSATGILPELLGEVAVAYSNDAMAPSRGVLSFQKTHKGILSILGGIFEGKFVDGTYMTEIANIPTKEVLLSKIAFLFKSPMQRLAIAVNEIVKKR